MEACLPILVLHRQNLAGLNIKMAFYQYTDYYYLTTVFF